MEVAIFPNTSMNVHQSTRCLIEKDFDLFHKSCEDITSRIKV